MEIEFDFRKERSSIFGEILRPVAKITFVNGSTESEELVYMDFGADVTLISRSVGGEGMPNLMLFSGKILLLY